MDIQFKRGTDAKRQQYVPKSGEPVFTTDTHELFIGDGATAGGHAVGQVHTTGRVSADMLAVFNDATGKVLKGLDKAALLRDYVTNAGVQTAINNAKGNLTVKHAGTATTASTATNATMLGNHPVSYFINTDLRTDSYTEGSATKFVSSKGIKQMYTVLNSSINTKLNKSAVSDTWSQARSGVPVSEKALHLVDVNAGQAKSAASTAQSTANSAKSTASSANSKATHNASEIASVKSSLSHYQPKVLHGNYIPGPSVGHDGDVFIQYA